MEFEWDEAKNIANIAKHGIGFERAMLIFEDVYIWQVDDRFEYDEQRYIATGLLEQAVVFVIVYAIRSNRIRIISARPASRKERQRYAEKIRRRTED